jgi:hypothetical protein
MSTKLKHSILVAVSFFLLLSSLFISSKVSKIEEEKSVKFGFPLAFISQDFIKNNNDFQFFPRYQKFEFKKISEINNFSIVNFSLSLVSIFLTLETLIWLLETIDFKIRNYFREK